MFISLLLLTALNADPVKIIASPAPAVPMPPAGSPVVLDVGKFVWLDLSAVAGPISWDFSTPGIVALPPDGSGDTFGGIKQGSTLPEWHKSPSKTAAPCLGVSEGTVTVSAWGVVDARAKRLAQLTIQVGPRGPPDPKPDPKPQPHPTAKDIYIVVVRAATSLTPAQANLISDVPFWNTFKTGKTDWAIHNPTDEPATKKGYADLAMKKQPGGNYQPVLIVLDMADGTPLYTEVIPANATKDYIKTEIAKVRK